MVGSLTEDEKLRFARQIVLKDIGETGQFKIRQSRVLVVGMGGLGTFSSLLLAEMGVGYLRIVDRDIVERTNLHRTPLFAIQDLDRAKVEVAADRLAKLNPSMKIDTHACHVNAANIDDLLEGIDIVIDALDNFETRRIINVACVQRNIPFIFCGVSARSGNLTVFNLENQSPCLSCLYHEINDDEMETCDITGIHPALLSIITGIQVHEAIQILVHNKSSLTNSLLFIDLLSLNFDKIPIQKNPNCPVCSTSSIKSIEPPNFDLSLIKIKLEKNFTLTQIGTHSLTLSLSNNVSMTIFKGGNILIRGAKTSQKATEIWDEIKTNHINFILS
ncbi:MAG: HesA/MoeB/ThiF family protein [Candidatus Hodarchaeales archaeon]|jgi:adenylyltransferase/sulfurtransferase